MRHLFMSDKLLTEGNTAASIDELYLFLTNLTAIEYIRNFMENTGKVTGAFDIDFDKREFSGVNIMDGWQTYALGDVSTAAYHATRKRMLFGDQQLRCLLDHLDGKEITSAGHLSSRNFSFSDAITEIDDKLNFYIDTTFDVDAVFGTDVCTDKNDDYINLYADYDMESGQVCDQLTIILWKGDGQSEEMSYTLNAAEKEVLLRKMDEYCQQQTGMLWMLEQNPQLQKVALCLDSDAAGQKAVGRLTGILNKHGYTDVTPILPEAKDWNDELVARRNDTENQMESMQMC